MFSGLIEDVGAVLAVTSMPSGLRARIRTPLTAELSEGESIAVNGVCLTVVETDAATFSAELSPETARVTTLGQLTAGAIVNLERSLKFDGRFGGHFVLGHVDGRGEVVAIREESDFHRVRVRFPTGLRALIVEKGSIAVDGTSLTVAALTDGEFDVQIVPYTWEHTNLHEVVVDDAVNLECDIIGKYVVNAVDVASGDSDPQAEGRKTT